MTDQEIWIRTYVAALGSDAIYQRSRSQDHFIELCVEAADTAVAKCPRGGYRDRP